MRKIHLLAILLSASISSCIYDDPTLYNNSGPAEEGPIIKVDFPNIDNTLAMNVVDQLSDPTNTNVKLDSMKMFYYQDYHYNVNGPGMAYKNQTFTIPGPTIHSVSHYFTYEQNGFVDKRTVVLDDHYKWNEDYILIFDYNYNDEDELESIGLVIETNNEVIYQNNIEYTSELEQQILSSMIFDNYNILSISNYTFETPKNIYNPENNLLPEDVKLQFLPLFTSHFSQFFMNDSSSEFYDFYYEYLYPNSFINTHCTFVKTRNLQEVYQYPLENIQYQVRADHYPEIIQYGQPDTGGYRNLYYYSN